MSKRFEGTADYVATDDLKIAVNAAIALERPLLIKGEPGTGKTRPFRNGWGFRLAGGPCQTARVPRALTLS